VPTGLRSLAAVRNPALMDARKEADRGMVELERFLATHAAFDRWRTLHPDQGDVVMRALAELKAQLSRGEAAA